MGSRLISTTYLYEDPSDPDRMTGAIASPAYTHEDRALLIALGDYEATLCRGCGEPKHLAWHSDMDGEYETLDVVCHACSAGAEKKTIYSIPRNTRSPAKSPLRRFQLGVTTVAS